MAKRRSKEEKESNPFITGEIPQKIQNKIMGLYSDLVYATGEEDLDIRYIFKIISNLKISKKLLLQGFDIRDYCIEGTHIIDIDELCYRMGLLVLLNGKLVEVMRYWLMVVKAAGAGAAGAQGAARQQADQSQQLLAAASIEEEGHEQQARQQAPDGGNEDSNKEEQQATASQSALDDIFKHQITKSQLQYILIQAQVDDNKNTNLELMFQVAPKSGSKNKDRDTINFFQFGVILGKLGLI